MTQKLLHEKVTEAFITNVNLEKVVEVLEAKREYIAPWVLKLLGTELPAYVRISSIIYALFENVVLEPAETIAHASTAGVDEEIGITYPFGDVLEVSECIGHVWVRFNFSDCPLSHIEFTIYDNEKNHDQ